MSHTATDLDPAADPAEPVEVADRLRAVDWRPLGLVILGQLIAGVLIGLIWLHWAPKTVAYLVANGSAGDTVLIPAESESQIAGDGRFVVLSLVAGLLFGVLAWGMRSMRGPAPLIALTIGGILSSLLARTVGQLFTSGSNSGRVNSVISPPLSLHAFPVLWLQALIAVMAYTALAGLTANTDLSRHPELGRHPKALDEHAAG